MNIRNFIDIAVTNREAGLSTCLFTDFANARGIIPRLLLEDTARLGNIELYDADKENKPNLFTITFDDGKIWCEPTFCDSGRIGRVETDCFNVYFDKESVGDINVSDYVLGNERRVKFL